MCCCCVEDEKLHCLCLFLDVNIGADNSTIVDALVAWRIFLTTKYSYPKPILI